VSKTGTRLYTKRKALYRDVEIPDSIFRYILMCRTHISKERQINKPARAVVWEEWLRRKLEYKNLGYRVGNRVREHVTKVRDENLALIEENKEYSAIRDRLTELGIDTEKPVYEWSFFNQLQETMSGIPQGLEYALKQAHRATGDAIERVESCRSITEKGE
jgi:phage gpG-like protein